MTDEERERTMEFILNQQANFFSDIEGLKESVSGLRDSMGDLRDSMGELRDSMGELREAQAQTQKQLDHITQLAGIFGEQTIQLQKQLEHGTKLILLAGEQSSENQKRLDGVIDLVGRLGEKTDEGQKTIQLLGARSFVHEKSVETLNEGMSKLAETMNTLAEMFVKHAADPNAHRFGNDSIA